MRMKLAALILLPLSLAACGEAKKGFDKSVEDNFLKEFVNSCTTSATKTGAPPALASKLCSCTADKLTAKYKGSELLSVPQSEMMEAGEKCIKEHGPAAK